VSEINEAVKQSSIPVTVSTLTFLNIQLADWVYILTMVYLALQIVYLTKKLFRKERGYK